MKTEYLFCNDACNLHVIRVTYIEWTGTLNTYAFCIKGRKHWNLDGILLVHRVCCCSNGVILVNL